MLTKPRETKLNQSFMKDFRLLFKKVGFAIENKELLKEAFTHRSVLNEQPQLVHNERLEFLGDAVLELITTEYLFKTYQEPEGVLTNYRSALVKRDTLAFVARRLDMGSYLILSRGEANSGGREKEYLLANTLESFIGAVYLEKGFKVVRDFIHQWILIELPAIIKSKAYLDAKSQFQELSQADRNITPHYEVISESGLDHNKTFTLGAFLEKEKVGQGVGGSKHEAQMKAAADALKNKDQWRAGRG